MNMLDTAAASFRAGLILWVRLVRRTAWFVVLLSVLLSAGSVVFFTSHLRINTDTTDMLSAELPFRKSARQMKAAFPQFSDNILVVIDGRTADLADDAALLMADKLRQRPKLFGQVFDLAGDKFFRRNGLLYLDVEELEELSDQLAEAQPFLGALWQDPSLRGLFEMLRLAIDETLKSGDAPPIELAKVLNEIAAVAEAQTEGRFSSLSWHGLMSAGGETAEDRRRFLLIQPALDFGSLQPASDAIKSIRGLVTGLGLVEGKGVHVRLTGSAALAQEELKSVEKGMGLAAVISFILVMGLLFMGLRSLNLVVSTLLTLIAGLVWTAAFAMLALGALNLISVAFAVLFIGLSVDFGIHFALRFREGRQRGMSSADSLEEAAEGVGGALTICAVSAAIAFYAFLPTDYRGLAELGLIAGTGMFIALTANLTLLPALLALWPGAAGEAADPRPLQRPKGGGGAELRRARVTCILGFGLGIAAAALASRAVFDFDPLNLKDPGTESVSTLLDLTERPETSPYSIEILAEDLDAAVALADRLSKLDGVEKAVTLADYVPKDQEAKLAVIGTMALFLGPALAGSVSLDRPDTTARLEAVASGLDGLRRLAGMPGGGKDAVAAARLVKALEGLSGDAALADLERRLLSGLPGRLARLRDSLDAEAVDIAELPLSLRQRQIAVDGQARVEVYPAEDLRDRQALTQFVDQVRTVAPGAIGSPVVILEAGRAVVAAFMEAGLIAVVFIAVLLMCVLRRLGDVLMVFAPIILAGLLSVAATVLFGLSFNFANIIVVPLLFGLGAAGGIHLVSRARRGSPSDDVFGTSTPRAVLFSSLTTIGSFGSIALSSHPGTASMGVLLTLSIVLTLFCTLIFLPALMTWAGLGRGEP